MSLHQFPALFVVSLLWLLCVGAPSPSKKQTLIFDLTSKEHQRAKDFVGVGAAMTGSSAWILMKQMNRTTRTSLLRDLFLPSTKEHPHRAGLSILRLTMSACSDFSLHRYTYDDLNTTTTSQVDYNLTHFSIDKDEEYFIPAIKAVLEINPNVTVIALPWTAPGWMKTDAPASTGFQWDGNLNGGMLRWQDDRVIESYAQYFVRFVNTYYHEHGIRIHRLSVQNEPMFSSVGYPSMYLPVEGERRLATAVARALSRGVNSSQHRPLLLVLDHNWNLYEYAEEVLLDPSSHQSTLLSHIDGASFHCYGGSVGEQSKFRTNISNALLNTKKAADVWFTECTASLNDAATGFAGDMIWDMQNLFIGAPTNWAKSVLKWNLILNATGGPKLPGGCSTCRGIVTIADDGTTLTYNEDFFALAHTAPLNRGTASMSKHQVVIPTTFDSLSIATTTDPSSSLALLTLNLVNETTDVQVRWTTQGANCSMTFRRVPPRCVLSAVVDLTTLKAEWFWTFVNGSVKLSFQEPSSVVCS